MYTVKSGKLLISLFEMFIIITAVKSLMIRHNKRGGEW